MSTSTVHRKPYTGTRRKLVVAFDLARRSAVPRTRFWTLANLPKFAEFPRQQKVAGDSKIPSVVCYDEDGTVVAVGSETDPDTNPELFETPGIVRSEWFKLHLRPPRLAAEQGFNAGDLPPLPRNKTAIAIYSTQRNDDINFILSHPNGWEGRQQSEMRNAAISAGLVKNEAEALDQVSFVTEGEASLHYCLNNIPTVLERLLDYGVMVVDRGGGTIDISTYTRASDRSLKEISAAECLLQGSTFVTGRAEEYLKSYLHGSKFGGPEEIATMKKFFDKTTKTSFRNSSKPSFIKFGKGSDNDPDLNIKAGGLKLSGEKVASFFDPSVKAIIETIEDQCSKSRTTIKAICLVGGFATSDYLFSRLDGHFKERDIQILRPDRYLNKAVAEGAVSYHIDHRVSVRVSKFTFGIEATRLFEPTNPEHICRPSLVYPSPSGPRRIEGIFSEILAKASSVHFCETILLNFRTQATAVSEEKEFRKTYFHELPRRQFEEFDTVELVLKCYRGRAAKAPLWLDLEPEFFEDNCDVIADLTTLKSHLKPLLNGGKEYFRFELDVVLLFGLTELKAHIAWKEDGVEKRGPATIVYDTTMSNSD
ncbi:hypothetical protein F5887DRAFT_1286197 [Amanita rubescens]|nr:hypothetical protein F5887DRAFT_1286197 [Amanita rubescens]